MIYTDLTKKAMRVCFDAHKNQKDKSKLPYVFHPFHLAEQMDDEESTIVALLHDVVEDAGDLFPMLYLESMGFGDSVIEALKLLTHDDGVPYMDYIERIKTNPLATKVKLADLAHNSDRSRWNNDMTEEELKQSEERLKKYEAAIKKLKE